jgi:hypothetical protein
MQLHPHKCSGRGGPSFATVVIRGFYLRKAVFLVTTASLSKLSFFKEDMWRMIRQDTVSVAADLPFSVEELWKGFSSVIFFFKIFGGNDYVFAGS